MSYTKISSEIEDEVFRKKVVVEISLENEPNASIRTAITALRKAERGLSGACCWISDLLDIIEKK